MNLYKRLIQRKRRHEEIIKLRTQRKNPISTKEKFKRIGKSLSNTTKAIDELSKKLPQ